MWIWELRRLCERRFIQIKLVSREREKKEMGETDEFRLAVEAARELPTRPL